MIRSVKVILLNLAVIAFVLGTIACGDAANTNTANTNVANTTNVNASTNMNANANMGTNMNADANSNANADRASADGIGVDECDDYVEKWQACVNDKVPEAARTAFKNAFDTTTAEWRKAASTEAGRTGLAAGCKAAMDAAKASFSAYNCAW